MNILLLGKNGQLGKEFIRHFEQHSIPYAALSKDECDISNHENIQAAFQRYQNSDVVINATGYVYVDKAEGEGREDCFRINRDSIQSLSEIAHEHKKHIVHFSTDYVFDGKKGSAYNENDQTNPLNVYGQSKQEGEVAVSQFANTVILRTSWLYGEGENNFIKKFLAFTAQKDILPMTHDEISVPTSAAVLMKGTMLALEQQLHGIFHLVNSGHASRLEFAQEILDILDMPNKTLMPIAMSYWNAPAQRPEFSAMSNDTISRTLNIEIPHWKESLREFLITQ